MQGVYFCLVVALSKLRVGVLIPSLLVESLDFLFEDLNLIPQFGVLVLLLFKPDVPLLFLHFAMGQFVQELFLLFVSLSEFEIGLLLSTLK